MEDNRFVVTREVLPKRSRSVDSSGPNSYTQTTGSVQGFLQGLGSALIESLLLASSVNINDRETTMTVVPSTAEPVPMSEEQKFLFDL